MEYSAYFEFLRKTHDCPFIFRSGNIPVLISAPHAYRHIRNGRIKNAETGAGAIALFLNEHKNTHCMVKTAENEDDPNYNEKSPYKNALLDYIRANSIRYVLDIHELKPGRETEINPLINGGILIDGYEKLYNIIKEIFLKNKFKVTEDFPFSGKNPNGIAAFLRKNTEIFVLQLEINCRLIYPESGCNQTDRVCTAFSDIVDAINKFDKKIK